MSKLVYIAGPYTNPDPIENIHNAVRLAEKVYAISDHWLVPVIPHSATLAWQMVCPHSDVNFWYDYDIEVMLRCDAVLRFPGDSTGADNEVARAEAEGIPVFYNMGDLLAWMHFTKMREAI